MALSKPNGIANRGDAQRVARAVACFASTLLQTDPRVDVFYRHWRDACDSFFANDMAADAQALNVWRHTMQDETALFIREQLPQLSQWAEWLGPYLQNAFTVRTLADRGASDGRMTVAVRISDHTPSGRQLPRDGRCLERNVYWFYRHKVKHPADSILEIAKQYATEVKRADVADRAGDHRRTPGRDARAHVRGGINQIVALFDVAAKAYLPERRTR